MYKKKADLSQRLRQWSCLVCKLLTVDHIARGGRWRRVGREWPPRPIFQLIIGNHFSIGPEMTQCCTVCTVICTARKTVGHCTAVPQTECNSEALHSIRGPIFGLIMENHFSLGPEPRSSRPAITIARLKYQKKILKDFL